jgi:hypothetical protein
MGRDPLRRWIITAGATIPEKVCLAKNALIVLDY